VRADIRITLPHPRDQESEAFKSVVDDIYRQLAVGMVRSHAAAQRPEQIGIAYRLPPAGVQPLLGLIDAIHYAPFNDRGDLADVAENETLEMDRLLILVEAMQLLGFATVTDMSVALTKEAAGLHDADIQESKRIFGEHVLKHVPLIRHIRQVLTDRADHAAPETRFLTELQDHVSPEDAQDILDVAINWARYAELFSYDYDSGVLSLDPPE
jgi:NitT/TauT family transport system ATP-binding protein